MHSLIRNKWLKLITALPLALVLVVAFQNCSSPGAEFSSGSTKQDLVAAPPSSSYSGGNGGGYDGKPYVLPDLARTCTDGDAARSRIVEKAGVFRLVRRDCSNLSSPPVVSVTRAQTIATDSLVYDSKVFDSQDRLVAGTQLPTKGYCTEVTSAATISVPQTVGTDFDVALVVAVSGPDLVASMLFMDNSSSDDYETPAVRIGANPGGTGPLVGPYSYRSGVQQLDFNFVNGEAVTLAKDIPVTDVDTPSVTGTLVDFDSTLTKCSWN